PRPPPSDRRCLRPRSAYPSDTSDLKAPSGERSLARTHRCAELRGAHEPLVDRTRGRAALRDRPHDEALAARRVTACENARHRRRKPLVHVDRAPLRHVHSEAVADRPLGPGESHRDDDEVGSEALDARAVRIVRTANVLDGEGTDSPVAAVLEGGRANREAPLPTLLL